jgi:hypothetical protein
MSRDEDPEDKRMGHEEQRNQHCRDEVRGTLQPWMEPHVRAIPFIKGVEQIGGTHDVEHPDQRRPHPAP